MEKKYIQAVETLFNALGGYENIEFFTHCMTRMRFHLKDWSIIDEQAIKNDKAITGIKKNTSSNEYHIIIGMGVADFYKTFCEINNYDLDGRTIINQEPTVNKNKTNKQGEFENENKEIKSIKNKFRVKGWLGSSMTFISKVFSPIVYPLLGYGLILSLWSILTVEWGGAGTNTSAESIHFFEQLNSILGVLTGTFTLFITVTISYTTFIAMRGNGIYGIVIGIVLTAPSLLTMGDVAGSEGGLLQSFPGWTLFGDGTTYPWKINFNGLIIPMLIVAIFGAYMERWCSKISNVTAKTILSPVLIILVTFIFAVFIIAPIGMLFTNYLSVAINWLSTNNIAKYIAIPLLGALYGPLVITGLHHSITPIILQGQEAFGGTILQGFITISNISQGVAAIAFTLLHKRVRRMQNLGASNGVAAIVGGITEPALFTVNLKHLFPLIATSIGVFCGTLILVASQTYAFQGASSIFGILMFQQQAPAATGATTWIGGGFLWGTISIITSVAVTFTLTFVLGKTKFFWNRSRQLILEDFNEDVNELKLISKQDFKLILINEKQEKLKEKNLKKEARAELKATKQKRN